MDLEGMGQSPVAQRLELVWAALHAAVLLEGPGGTHVKYAHQLTAVSPKISEVSLYVCGLWQWKVVISIIQ